MLSERGKTCQRTEPEGVPGPGSGARVQGARGALVSGWPERMLESPAPPGGAPGHGAEREFSTGVEKTVENKGFLQSQA